MDFIENIKSNAKKDIKTIAFPESDDERVLRAVSVLYEHNIVNPVLIGDRHEIDSFARELGLNLAEIEVRDPKHDDNTEKFVQEFYELRKEKGMTQEEAKKTMDDKVYFATMMLKNGMVDGLVSGAAHATADTLRPALQIIKTKEGVKIASSFFFMILDEKIYMFSDCGFIIDPNSEELADIAISTAESARFFGVEPKVALLSFSTHGSAKHERVDKVAKAVELLHQKKPNFFFDGELQLDAAIVPKVASMKAPKSEIKGEANVLIFPNLDAGNIGYKLVQRLAGAEAVGPIVQGLKKPVNDLSRGCDVDDIINVAAITAVQAQRGH
jgi:phosphate acetyltransferase